MELQFHPGPVRKLLVGWFYYKEICYDTRSPERKFQQMQINI